MNVSINNSFTKTDKIFNKVNSSFTIKEKIEIFVIRYDYNYFLEVDLNQLCLPEVILPIQYVTRDLYNKNITKDQKAKSKKLSWMLKNQDQLFASEFKQKYSNNDFKSVREAETYASKIYSEYSPLYQSSKATVKSINGTKTWITKKRPYQDQEILTLKENIHTLDETDFNYFAQFKRQCLDDLSHNLNDFKQAVSLAANKLKDGLENSNIAIKLKVEDLEKRMPNTLAKDNFEPVHVNVVSVIQIMIDKDSFII